MDPIPMLDLEAQHEPLRSALEAAVTRVLASNRFISGEEVAAFERETVAALGAAHAIGVSSGTDALLALLMAAGVGPGDAVITTSYSFFATVEVIVRLGARPIFVDVDPLTSNIDVGKATRRLDLDVRAVVVTHLFGRMAPLTRPADACAAAGVPLVEDAAQAIGALSIEGGRRLSTGSRGAGAALSFFPAKNLGGFGDGGMVVTDDPQIADRIRLLRNHGASLKHRHEIIGGNFRLDELQAALLRVKLPHLATWSARRRQLAKEYLRRLAGLPVEIPVFEEGCVWNQFVIRVPPERRAALIEYLGARGIASAIHYPIPLHLQPALAYLGHRLGEFPVAEQAAREALALPIYPELGDDRLSRVADAMADFFR